MIFDTKKAADNAISRLTRGCLMLDDQRLLCHVLSLTDVKTSSILFFTYMILLCRPLVCSRDFPKEVGECGSFTGHQRLVDRALMSISKVRCCNSLVKRFFSFFSNIVQTPK